MPFEDIVLAVKHKGRLDQSRHSKFVTILPDYLVKIKCACGVEKATHLQCCGHKVIAGVPLQLFDLLKQAQQNICRVRQVKNLKNEFLGLRQQNSMGCCIHAISITFCGI